MKQLGLISTRLRRQYLKFCFWNLGNDKEDKNFFYTGLLFSQLSAYFKFYRNSVGKLTFRAQNNTDSANFRYTANKKYRSYHVRNLF